MQKHVVIVDPETTPNYPEHMDPTHQYCEAYCLSCGWVGRLSSRPSGMVDFAGWMHYEDTGYGSVVIDERDTDLGGDPHVSRWDPEDDEMDYQFCSPCGFRHVFYYDACRAAPWNLPDSWFPGWAGLYYIPLLRGGGRRLA